MDKIKPLALILTLFTALPAFAVDCSPLAAFQSPVREWNQIATHLDADGVDYLPGITAANQALLNSGFYLQPQTEWMNGEGQKYLDQPELLLSAPLDDVRLLLGGLSRKERFVAGAIGNAILTDVYLNAYRRCRDLNH